MKQFVFKKRRKATKPNGKRVTKVASTYTGRYRFPGDPRPTEVALGVTDKRVAEQKLAKIVLRDERRRAGLLLDEAEVEAARRPLSELLDEHVADLRARGVHPNEVQNRKDRIGRLFRDCHWTYLRDVRASNFTRWRGGVDLAPKTINDYLLAANRFYRWLVKRGQLSHNPLDGVDRVEQRGQESFQRRPLTVDESRRLLAVAGKQRPVYLTAVLTGLRRGALYKLRWTHVVLDAGDPRIEVPAGMMKNREKHVVPLTPELVAELRSIRPEPYDEKRRVFWGRLPERGCEFLKDHLKEAGIEYENERGRVDFHALRHTAATWGGATGVAGPMLQAFTGHKTASQVNRYVHPENLPARRIVDQLPTLLGGHPYGHPNRSQDGKSGHGVSHDGETLESAKPLENEGKTPQDGGPTAYGEKVSPTGFEPVSSP
ncbi:MAG: tyrosine-type recombinase/integrase [Phycisphaera sp.]|nr:tyrosine-type recombinase/integrase [Phycisphaera sp.]